MVADALFLFSRIVEATAGILLIAFWWPHRKTAWLACVPWIFFYLILSDVAHYWNTLATGRLLHGGLPRSSGLFDVLAVMAVLKELRLFLIVVMVVINAAYVLQRVTSLGPTELFLARQQRFQPLLGICLLGLLAAPGVIAWMGSWFFTAAR